MNIITHPEYEKLNKETETLTETLTEKIIKKDYLLYHLKPALTAEYMTKIGIWEYKIYEVEIKIRKIRRKIQLIQAKINKQEKINLKEIEKILKIEFTIFQEKLRKQLEELNKTLKYIEGQFLTEEETKEIKKIYKEIVKKLHPDLNPQITKEQQELFHNAVQAYENGDLETLKMIKLITEGEKNTLKTIDKLEELNKKINQLKANIEEINKYTKELLKTFPFDHQELLKNPNWIKERTKELQETLYEYEQEYKTHQQKLKNILERN